MPEGRMGVNGEDERERAAAQGAAGRISVGVGSRLSGSWSGR